MAEAQATETYSNHDEGGLDTAQTSVRDGLSHETCGGEKRHRCGALRGAECSGKQVRGKDEWQATAGEEVRKDLADAGFDKHVSERAASASNEDDYSYSRQLSLIHI